MQQGGHSEALEPGSLHAPNPPALCDMGQVSDSTRCYRELSAFHSPPWGAQPHSASVRTIRDNAEQILHTWADWWAIRKAPFLLQTPSGFSESARLLSAQLQWSCVLHNVSSVRICANALPFGAAFGVHTAPSGSEEARLRGSWFAGNREQIEL